MSLYATKTEKDTCLLVLFIFLQKRDLAMAGPVVRAATPLWKGNKLRLAHLS